jgi:hypothetical protein
VNSAENVLASQRHIAVTSLPHVPPAIFLAAVFNDVAFFKSLPVVQMALELAQWRAYKAREGPTQRTGGSRAAPGATSWGGSFAVDPPTPTPTSALATPLSAALGGAAASSAEDASLRHCPTLKILFERTDRHGFNVLQLAAVAGSADLLELFLDIHPAPDRLRHVRSRHGGLLHYGVTGRKAIADIFNAVRMHLLHDPKLNPVKASFSSLDDSIHNASSDDLHCVGSAAGAPVAVVGIAPCSQAASQRHLHLPFSHGAQQHEGETRMPALVPGLVAYVVKEAAVVGSLAGTTLTVTSVDGKKLQPGMPIFAPGITLGTEITAQLSGDAGAAGTYAVSIHHALAVPSTAIVCAPPDERRVGAGSTRHLPLGDGAGPAGLARAASKASLLLLPPVAESGKTVAESGGGGGGADSPREGAAEVGLSVGGPLGGGAGLTRSKNSRPTLLPRGASSSSLRDTIVDTEKCTPDEEEKHDPLHIHGIDYLRGLLKYSPQVKEALDSHKRLFSLPKLQAVAAAVAAAMAAGDGGATAGGGGTPPAEGGNTALTVINEIIDHTAKFTGAGGGGGGGGGATPSPSLSDESVGSGGSGLRIRAPAVGEIAGSLPRGLGSGASLSSSTGDSASVEEVVYMEHMGQAADHALIFHGKPPEQHNKKILAALQSESLVGVEELHMGHGEDGTLPYLDARVNLTLAEHQIDDINDIPWEQRFPKRSKPRTVQVLLKHFPARPKDGERQGLQFANQYLKTPLDMVLLQEKQEDEDPDDVLASVCHDSTHVLHDPPWWTANGRGLLQAAKEDHKAELKTIEALLRADPSLIASTPESAHGALGLHSATVARVPLTPVPSASPSPLT